MVETIHYEICKIEECTGCKMCGNICPQGAISYKENDEGFWYPVIDDKKCNRCGLCNRKCPVVNKKMYISDYDKEVYSAISKNNDLRNESTSGGVFGELASYILKDGGIVVGCRYSEDYKSAYHTICDSDENLHFIIGSKYFQSNTEGIYLEVKKYLESGKKVLFAGTPCQNAALKSYLSKEYDNLFQMDFVCNSINSPLVYRKWLEDLEKQYNSVVKTVRFKDKKEGWDKLNTEVCFENGEVHREDRYDSIFGKGFIKYNLFQRKSCYSCCFRGEKNSTADITVGDFWGLDNVDTYDYAKGVSIVIINSLKGKQIFDYVKNNLIVQKQNLEIAIKNNPRIVSNPKRHEKRNLFFDALSSHSFEESLYLCTGEKCKNKKNNKPSINELINIWKNKQISFFKYLYLNYFSSNVERTGLGKIIPYKKAIFDLDKNSKIKIHGDKDIHVGMNRLNNSSAETLIRMGKGAIMELYHGGDIAYGVTIEIKNYAQFTAGWFGLNTGSVIVCQRRICLGEEVLAGRNVFIFDSDFHKMLTMKGTHFNFPQDVVIKDHVWLAGDVRITGGVEIGNNCIVDHFAIIKGKVPDWSFVSSVGKSTYSHLEGRWSRKSNNAMKKGVNSKGKYRQILVGFGKEGKAYYESQSEFIDYIIDNNSSDRRVQTFKDFADANKEIDTNMIFVIGSTKFNHELTKMIKKKYRNALIVSTKDIIYI